MKMSIELPEQEEEKSKEMEALYFESFRDFKEGQVVQGHVLEIRSNHVLVDISYKSEGLIPLYEFTNKEELKPGDEITVLIESMEDEEGRVVLSKKKADRLEGWDRIMENCEEGSIVEGKIFKKVRGGMMVDIGMEAFLPASLASIRPFKHVDQLIGQQLKFKIVKLNKKRKNIVLSHKDFLLDQRQVDRKKILEELKTGEFRKGRVKNITDFGAFIDLGGVDGLLHITDISWSRISHPSDVLSVGTDLEVKILNIDKENGKVSLGLKHKTENPWKSVGDKYQVGSPIKGKVVNLMPYGAFIELEKGIEGLAHISELSWTRHISHPSELLKVGDEVEASILNVDTNAQKISLGIKQLEANPWEDIEKKFKVDQKINGTVRNITDYGAFVELGPGIDGLLHNTDISWTQKVTNPNDHLKKGDQVEVVILSIDKKSKKIALGKKQLEKDPWPEMVKEFEVGKKVKGKITKITYFGVFVLLKAECEGLVHFSQTPAGQASELSKNYKVEQEVEARIIKIDEAQRRIGLSLTQV
jgi:small subunit ribosomal protein S1